MARVIFPDGSLLDGETWADLERKLRENGWNPADEAKFRAEMANRARNWSGFEADTELVSRQFFEQLEQAGLLMIVREKDDE